MFGTAIPRHVRSVFTSSSSCNMILSASLFIGLNNHLVLFDIPCLYVSRLYLHRHQDHFVNNLYLE